MFPHALVVPLDGSDFAAGAIAPACALMRPRDGEVLLVTTLWDGDVVSPRRYLDRVADSIEDVEVRTVVIQDRTAAAAIDLVLHEAAGRMLCMTTHGRGRVRWAMLGSVAEEVMSRTHADVLLIGRQAGCVEPNRSHPMLLCVDGSSTTPAVLPMAIEWARKLDLDVQVAMAIHPLDPVYQEPAVDQIVERIASAGLRARQTILRSSYPAGALADLAQSLDAGLVAMSRHARTRVGRLALGSVTMGVVGMVRCPVLVADVEQR